MSVLRGADCRVVRMEYGCTYLMAIDIDAGWMERCREYRDSKSGTCENPIFDTIST